MEKRPRPIDAIDAIDAIETYLTTHNHSRSQPFRAGIDAR